MDTFRYLINDSRYNHRRDKQSDQISSCKFNILCRVFLHWGPFFNCRINQQSWCMFPHSFTLVVVLQNRNIKSKRCLLFNLSRSIHRTKIENMRFLIWKIDNLHPREHMRNGRLVWRHPQHYMLEIFPFLPLKSKFISVKIVEDLQ